MAKSSPKKKDGMKKATSFLKETGKQSMKKTVSSVPVLTSIKNKKTGK